MSLRRRFNFNKTSALWDVTCIEKVHSALKCEQSAISPQRVENDRRNINPSDSHLSQFSDNQQKGNSTIVALEIRRSSKKRYSSETQGKFTNNYISSRQNYDLTNGRKPLRDFIQCDQALVGLGAMKSPMSNKSIDRKFAQDFKIHKGRNYNQSNRNMIIKKESKQKAANSLKDILSSISTTKNKL